jgi:hypothetical protein
VTIKAPFYRYEGLRTQADSFSAKYNPQRVIPVPIELIIEADFGIDIVPVPGLSEFDTVAFITRDLKEIRVDEFVYFHRPNRYRFSLAHEIAHKILHAEVFGSLEFHNIETWKRARTDLIPEDQYRYLEIQANSFAGLVLVPSAELRDAFFDYVEKGQALNIDFDDVENGSREMAEFHLSEMFQVSPDVLHIRLERDKLWHDE